MSRSRPVQPWRRQTENERSQAAAARAHKRQHFIFFSEADRDDDDTLTFEEFLEALPRHVRAKHPLREVREWFEMIDADANGSISMAEYLNWSLKAASIASGSGVVNIFREYDSEDNGSLSEFDFCRAARDVGFGDHARSLFQQLPRSADGTIDYVALLAATADARAHISGPMKAFLVAMAWNGTAEAGGAGTALDTSGWSFEAETAEGARREIQKLLAYHSVKVSEVFGMIDASDDASVCEPEFLRGLEGVLGFKGPRRVLEEVFAEVDDDGSGRVTFEELSAWLEASPGR